MPTTANFSLEYPDDNSSVDIAGHFETLADDVDEAINTRLALSGGTLTGALVGTLTTDSSSSTTGAFKTAGGMGIAKALYVGTTLNVTGTTTLTGDLTISKASPILRLNASAATHTNLYLDSPAGYASDITFRSGTAARWAISKMNSAESGSDVGSDFQIFRYKDDGSYSVPFKITRSTGATTLTGDLTISKTDPVINMSGAGTAIAKFSSTTGTSEIRLNSATANGAYLNYMTADSKRWAIWKTNDTESGSNAGSNLEFHRYSDAGASIGAALTITRSTGAVTLTGDLTISKASATARINATSGDSEVHIDRTAGNGAYVVARTGTSSRWRFGSGSDAESGSNVGSDFILGRFSDAGSYIDAPLTVYRSTGKVSIGSVGATAGLQLGAGGPRVMSGTGSPEGVVTAPVGSQWIDTAATTGAVAWRKATGAGSSGWVVEYGDTGSRDISSVLTADADRTLASTILLRRTGNRVVLLGIWRETTTSPNNRAFYSLPVGFRPSHTLYQYVPYDAAATSAYRSIRVPASGNITYGGPTSGSNYEYYVQWTTPDAWPSSLPGSAA